MATSLGDPQASTPPGMEGAGAELKKVAVGTSCTSGGTAPNLVADNLPRRGDPSLLAPLGRGGRDEPALEPAEPWWAVSGSERATGE